MRRSHPRYHDRMLVRRGGIAVLLGCLVGCSGGASTSASKSPAVAPIVNEAPAANKPFLWRVDSANGPSYLLGAMHLGVDPFKAFSTGVWKVFDEAQVLVLEVDVTGVDSLGLGMQPDGKSLDKEMTPAQWAGLLAALKVEPGSAAADKLEGVKAWVLVAELTNELAPQTPSIDTEFHKRAVKSGKRLEYFEDSRVQAAILDRFATPTYLLELVADLKGYRASLAAEAKFYLQGDAVGLAKMSIKDLTKQIGEDGMEALLYSRNRNWMGKLDGLMRAGGAFVLAGTAHMLGDRGLVSMLRKRGFTVTRVAP